MDSGGLEEELVEALPNNEAMGPPPPLSQNCNVEGMRKSYQKPFPIT
jgi:hypothetical protein